MQQHGNHQRQRRLASGLAAALAFAAVALLHFLSSEKGANLELLKPLLTIERAFQDLRSRSGRPAPANPRLLFLSIDDPSIRLSLLSSEEKQQAPFNQMEGWPWPRSVYGAVLDRLCNAGARLVIFDLIFNNPGRNDEVFREAIARWPDRVLLACNLEQTRGTQITAGQFPSPTILPPLPNSACISGGSVGGGCEDVTVMDPRLGCIVVFADFDACLREALYRTDLASQNFVPESIAARVIRIAGPPGSTAHIPDSPRKQLIRFTGPPSLVSTYNPAGMEASPFRPHSLYEIFLPSFWERNYKSGEFFRDAIVIVGSDGNVLKDTISTPMGLMPGPELHLNAINALWHNAFLTYLPLWADILIIAATAFMAWVLSVAFKWRLASLAFAIGAALGYVFLSGVAYDVASLQLIYFSPLAALACTWVAAEMTDYTMETVYHNRMRATLERYVSKSVASELLDNPDTVLNTWGGVRRHVTVLFSDLRGFTSRSEAVDPVEMVNQLNEYFREMSRPVLDEQGTLDKFIGDAMMAVWGNLLQRDNREDAMAAVRSALRMRRALVSLNKRRTEKAGHEGNNVRQGIGIHCGDAVVGNLGCEEKMDPTVIGDTVNLASRIEGLTKQYRCDLLISGSVATLLQGAFRLQPVDRVLPLGRTQPVDVHFVVCSEEEAPKFLSAADKDFLHAYQTGYDFASNRNFAEAARHFQAALKIRPDDFLAGLHLQRCHDALLDSNHHAWSGIAVMETK
ncbi:MAG: CHASE2 domain-containing protein [Candidatus Methylacidiphilales bacterium]